MSSLTFNFHNLAAVRISSVDSGALRFFESEYKSSGAVPSQCNRLVNLRWQNDLALRSAGPGYHFHVHKFLARWSYRIAIQKDNIDIEALGNRTAIPMIHHMLVHPSLRYLCAHSEALMLHGSAVVRNDRSVVFTGTGGTGKTTISSLLLLHGGKDWKLHADDYTFLTKDPKSYSYMTRSHLYRDHLRWIPEIKSILTPLERIRLEYFGRIRQITREGIKWPLRVDAARLWPDYSIAPSADLAGIIILGKERVDSPNLRRIQPTDEIIDELIEMNFYEARHFVELVERSLSGSDFVNWLDAWKEKERTLLSELLQETSLFRLELPSIGKDKGRFGAELVNTLTPIIGGGGLNG